MSRNIRLFLHSIGEESRLEGLLAFGFLSLSLEARKRNRRYRDVQAIFSAALKDPDTVIDIEVKGLRKPTARQTHKWILLGVLVFVCLFEYRIYSGPRFSEWCGTILHKCGLR